MVWLMVYVFIFLFFINLFKFVCGSFSVMGSLLSLDMLNLNILMTLIFISFYGFGDLTFLLYFLVLLVCEGCLGIGIMASAMRWCGEEKVFLSNMC